MLQKKAIFLVALASGGRISEISALQRGPSHIRFSLQDILLIQARDFLAKNENSQRRRDPSRTRALGTKDPLCPVLTLKSYLERTSNAKTRGLFLYHIKQTTLSIAQIRTRMLSLIRTANPGSSPKVHGIRKYATTLAFLNEANFFEIAAFTG